MVTSKMRSFIAAVTAVATLGLGLAAGAIPASADDAPPEGTIKGLTLKDTNTSYISTDGTEIFSSLDKVDITTDIGYSVKDQTPVTPTDSKASTSASKTSSAPAKVTPAADEPSSQPSTEPSDKPTDPTPAPTDPTPAPAPTSTPITPVDPDAPTQTKPFEYKLPAGDYELLDSKKDVTNFSVVVSSEAPVINTELPKSVTVDDTQYILNGGLTYSATADAGIRSVSAKDGDTDYKSGASLSAGIHTIVVTAVSNTNITSTKTVKVFVGQDTPTVKMTSSSKVAIQDGTAYYVDAPVIKIDTSAKTGIGDIKLVSDDGNQYPVQGDTITIPGDGAYSIVVTNELGISTTTKIDSTTLTDFGGDWTKFKQNVANSTLDLSGSTYTDGAGTDWWPSVDKIQVASKPDLFLPVASVNVKINDQDVQTEGTSFDSANFADKIKTVPADRNSYNIEVTYTDILGISTTHSVTAHVDNTAPVVKSISANGATSTLNPGNDGTQYIFFFKNGGSITLGGSDDATGIKSFNYTLYNSDGGVNRRGTVDASGIVQIPANFKGYVGDITATDQVNNTSPEAVKSNGMVSEDMSVAVNSNAVVLSLPGTSHKTLAGIPLYNYHPALGISAVASWAGLQNVHLFHDSVQIGSWGTGSFTRGEGNLFTNFQHSIGGADSGTYSADMADNVGFTAQNKLSLVVDTVAPRAAVSWNQTKASGIYNSPRVASIRIYDANVSPDTIHVETSGQFSGFSMSGTDLVGTVTYASDIQHTSLKITGADLAGNPLPAYTSETFSIDRTAPVMTVTPNGSAKNGKYYNKVLSFTVTVRDANVDSGSLQVSSGYSRTGWVSAGNNIWTTSVSSAGDGPKKLTLGISDLAGNNGNGYSLEYVQDTIAPQMSVRGITGNAVYTKGEVTLGSSVMDTNLDAKTVTMSYSKDGMGSKPVRFTNNDPTHATSATALIGNAKNSDGYYTVNMSSADLAGNVTTKTVSFTVDRFGGTVKFLSSAITYVARLDKDIVLTTTSYIRIPLDNFVVKYSLNGTTYTLPKDMYKVAETYDKGTGLYTYTLTISRKFATKDGVYALQAYTKDSAGVTSGSAGLSYKFVIDTHAPTLYLSMSSNSNYYYGDKYTYSATDTYGLKSVSFNGQTQQAGGQSKVTSASPYSVGKNQAFMLVAYDRAGNQATYGANGVNVYANFFARYRFGIVTGVALMIMMIAAMIYLIARDRHKVIH